ncbi:phage baseplate assembly protein [Candidatus Dactylopiibacterium carminicum]|uniref:phage baseplate assembly protein n=1 Tax=Candidatus Dactylopiibacterium carminicum TaxID=857335 RepID=UPI0016499514|nr:hypothetical protein [Candidatus Dactylopiibacterium carminicum]
MDDAHAEIRFNGQRYGHWQKVDVRESVDDLCASVRLAVTRPGVGNSLGVSENTVADVLVGGELVTRVRPDMLNRTVGAEEHAIYIEARSLGRELVDCQYSKTLSGLKLGEIVKRICSTFAVPVKIAVDTAVVPEFSMQCELPANALINAVRAANLLLYRGWSLADYQDVADTAVGMGVALIDAEIAPLRAGVSRVGARTWSERSRYILRVRYSGGASVLAALRAALEPFKQGHIWLLYVEGYAYQRAVLFGASTRIWSRQCSSNVWGNWQEHGRPARQPFLLPAEVRVWRQAGRSELRHCHHIGATHEFHASGRRSIRRPSSPGSRLYRKLAVGRVRPSLRP